MKSKLSLLFSLFLLFAIHCIAQTQIRTQIIIGGTEDDYPAKLCLDRNGFLVAGNSNSNSSKFKSQNSRGGSDFWVVKYSRNKVTGQLGKMWDRTIGSSGDDYLVDTRTTRDGGYLLVGNTSSGISGDKTSPNLGFTDYWLVKLNSKGNIAWQKGMGTDGQDFVYGVDTTTDGGFVLIGTLGFGTFGLQKLNAPGNVQWTKTFTTKYCSVDQAKDGSYLLASFDGDIARADANGNILWTKNYKAASFTYSQYKVSEAGDGSILLSEALGFDDSPSGGYPYYTNRLYKLDANGNKQWYYDVEASNLNMAALQTKEGGFLIGSSISLGTDEFPYTAIYLNKLNASGALEWDRAITGAASFADVVEPVAGMYFVGSNADGSCGSCGDKTKPPVGKWDYWIIALQDTTSVEGSKQLNSIAAVAKKQILNIYPNPANNELYINIRLPSDIMIFNQQGQVVLKKAFGKSGTLSIQHLQNGVYYVKDTNTGAVQKLIVQH